MMGLEMYELALLWAATITAVNIFTLLLLLHVRAKQTDWNGMMSSWLKNLDEMVITNLRAQAAKAREERAKKPAKSFAGKTIRTETKEEKAKRDAKADCKAVAAKIGH